jgi:hypothetical protein
MSVRKAVAATGLVAVAVAGGALGATLIGTADAAAPTPSPSPTAGGGSNEDTTHEGGESAARETAENNGTATFGGRHHHGGGPNEDPAHEAGESAARESAEGTAGARMGGRSHEDPGHEASESAARETAEGGQASPNSTTATPSPTSSPSP